MVWVQTGRGLLILESHSRRIIWTSNCPNDNNNNKKQLKTKFHWYLPRALNTLLANRFVILSVGLIFFVSKQNAMVFLHASRNCVHTTIIWVELLLFVWYIGSKSEKCTIHSIRKWTMQHTIKWWFYVLDWMNDRWRFFCSMLLFTTGTDGVDRWFSCVCICMVDMVTGRLGVPCASICWAFERFTLRDGTKEGIRMNFSLFP